MEYGVCFWTPNCPKLLNKSSVEFVLQCKKYFPILSWNLYGRYPQDLEFQNSEYAFLFPRSIKSAIRCSFFGFRSSFPSRNDFWSKFFHNTDVVRGFSEQNFPRKWKLQNFDFRVIDVFPYFPVRNFICQICGLIRQAKKVKNPNFFRLCKSVVGFVLRWNSLTTL
jgi:hypothetical protein